MALESGAEFMMSIDDDNYCLPNEDFFAAHRIVTGEPTSGHSVHSSTGWFNICEMLTIHPAINVYPRGFPYFARHKSTHISQTAQQGSVHMNAGLWLAEPDLDAMTWLIAPVCCERHARRIAAFEQPSLVTHQHSEYGHSSRCYCKLLLRTHGVSPGRDGY